MTNDKSISQEQRLDGESREAISEELNQIREAMEGPPTGETLEQIVARKRGEQGL